MKTFAFLVVCGASLLLGGCVSDDVATTHTTTTTEETSVHSPAVSETRTVRTY